MISPEEALGILREEGCGDNVIAHCMEVSRAAAEIAGWLTGEGKKVDIELVRIGGLLHDLGRCHVHDITHACEGARMAEKLGLDKKLVAIIRNHIGAGITKEEAVSLGLPEEDFLPRTLEEKIVAHADNLIKGTERISIEKRAAKMRKKGASPASVQRVLDLAEELGIREL
jgi:uncharacterized protein